MPQLRLEYSSNVKESVNPADLFSPCHQILVDIANANLFYCQGRAIARDQYHVGDGSKDNAFVYLEIKLLEGRSEAVRHEVGKQILKVLERYFARSFKELNMQIGIHVTEISKAHYFKTESRK